MRVSSVERHTETIRPSPHRQDQVREMGRSMIVVSEARRFALRREEWGILSSELTWEVYTKRGYTFYLGVGDASLY